MTVVTHAATIEEAKLIDEVVHSLRPGERVVATVPEGSGQAPEIYLIPSEEAVTITPLTRFREELLKTLPSFKGGVAHVLIAAKRTM